MKFIKAAKVVLSILVFSSISMASAVASDSASNVNLVATLKNGPAMTPVTWKVYRIDNNSRAGESSKKHSMSLQLRTGTYKAVAVMDSVTRDRIFTVKDNSKVDVVIAMDK